MKLTVLIVAAALLGGCSTLPPPASGGFYPSSPAVYTAGQAQQAQYVRLGVVERVSRAVIRSDTFDSGAGAAAGAALGALVGQKVGGGNGRYAAGILAGLAGSALGRAAVERTNQQPGIEVLVRLDDGSLTSVAQAADVPLAPGQRVRIVGSWPARVLPY